MGLWDALSGKTLQWNRMRSAAYRQMLLRLRPFVVEYSAQFPGAERQLTELRNRLFAFFFSYHNSVGDSLDNSLAMFKDRIMGFSVESYLQLGCCLNSYLSVAMFSHDERQMSYYLQGVIDVYKRPPAYVYSSRFLGNVA